MQLKILMLEERDFGKYSCRARNNLGSDSDVAILSGIYEPRREKTGFLPMRKQRRRSASQ